MNSDTNDLFTTYEDNEDFPPEVRLKCRTLSSVERTEIEWLWKNRFPQKNLTILEGDGGVGKSTVVADICSRWSAGLSLPDDDTVRAPMNILLLSAEDDPGAVLRPRFEAHNADLERVRIEDQALILDSGGLDALAEAIKTHQIDVVVIDPIVAFLGQKIDMNKGNDVRSVLGPLGSLARDLGCTFVVVRHFNKMRDGQASQRGAGSVDFRNAARSVLQVVRSEEQTYVVLEKTNYAAKARTLPFSVQEGRLIWGEPCDLTADQLHGRGRGPAKRKFAEAVDFLKDQLSDGPKLMDAVRKSAADMGISEGTLRRAREELDVRRSGKAHWMIDDGGFAQNEQNAQSEQDEHLEQNEVNQMELELER
jgi:hypothetical protein